MNYWIIAKPEVLLFCREELKQSLLSEGFQLQQVHQIKNWDQLSLSLYADSQKVSIEQLQLQNIGRTQLLGSTGNLAEYWELSFSAPMSQEEGYQKLNLLKRAFRDAHWHSGLDIHFSLNNSQALYHYSYFHVPDPELTVIESEQALIWRFI